MHKAARYYSDLMDDMNRQPITLYYDVIDLVKDK